MKQLLVKGGQRFAMLKNGEKIPADVVLCGTGWQQEVPFLAPDMRARIMAARGNFRLYRQILPTDARNLAFTGYNSFFFSPLSDEIVALWIAANKAGALKLPTAPAQLKGTGTGLRWMEKRTEGKHARGTNIIPVSMHQIDGLVERLNLPSRDLLKSCHRLPPDTVVRLWPKRVSRLAAPVDDLSGGRARARQKNCNRQCPYRSARLLLLAVDISTGS